MEGVAFHALPADQLGAGHPAGIQIPIMQLRQRFFVHGQKLIGKVHALFIALRLLRRFQKTAHTDPRAALLCRPIQVFQHLGVDGVVTVHIAQPLSLGHWQSVVSRRRLALIGLVNHTNPLIPLGVFVTDCAALVGTAVLNQHQLKIRKRLAQNAVNTIIQVFFRPVYRDNNADYRHFSHPSLLHSRSSRCHRIAAG